MCSPRNRSESITDFCDSFLSSWRFRPQRVKQRSSLEEDKLGLDAIYIQAKRWSDRTVGRPEIQQFAGALAGQGAHKGIFITTSSFTSEARGFISRVNSKIVLIDGDELAELMIDHSIGVTTMVSYDLKRIDSDYFVEEE